MIVYMGFRIAGICYVYRWDASKPARPDKVAMRNDLWNHSPTGPEWGYLGSGPAQLALALAADALADGQRAVRIHQHLKRSWVGSLPRDCWSITRDALCAHICALEKCLEREEVWDHGER